MAASASMASLGRQAANDWIAEESVAADADGDHLPNPTTRQNSEDRFDLSDWEDENFYESWGTDNGFVRLCSRTEPSTPCPSMHRHSGCKELPFEIGIEQDDNRGSAIDCPAIHLDSPNFPFSAESEVHRGSDKSTSPKHPNLGLSIGDAHSGIIKSVQDEEGSIIPDNNTGIFPPIHTLSTSSQAGEGTPTSSMEWQTDRFHRPSMAISEEHHEASTRTFSDINAPPVPQTPHPPNLHRLTSSTTSSHSVYFAPAIPILHYRNDSPSCFSILFNLLTEPFRRLRARKRSVRESAAMDRELRELHAQMREMEMWMRQSEAQPPRYGNLRKYGSGGGGGGAGMAMQGTREAVALEVAR